MGRPAVSRDDETAIRLLDAAAELIDAALTPDPADVPPRLRAIRFPAALDWVRVEDVLRVASEKHPISKKAFANRWATREEFIRDALIHAMLYRDQPDEPATRLGPNDSLDEATGANFSTTVGMVADRVFRDLVLHPRSFLVAHLAPTLAHHPTIREVVFVDSQITQNNWATGYLEALTNNGLALRPGWTVAQLTLALQCILDGFVLRQRVDPRVTPTAWESTSLFANAVLALLCGAMDLDRAERSTAEWLDDQVSRGGEGESYDSQ